jgi:hypothetical protein
MTRARSCLSRRAMTSGGAASRCISPIRSRRCPAPDARGRRTGQDARRRSGARRLSPRRGLSGHAEACASRHGEFPPRASGLVHPRCQPPLRRPGEITGVAMRNPASGTRWRGWAYDLGIMEPGGCGSSAIAVHDRVIVAAETPRASSKRSLTRRCGHDRHGDRKGLPPDPGGTLDTDDPDMASDISRAPRAAQSAFWRGALCAVSNGAAGRSRSCPATTSVATAACLRACLEEFLDATGAPRTRSPAWCSPTRWWTGSRPPRPGRDRRPNRQGRRPSRHRPCPDRGVQRMGDRGHRRAPPRLDPRRVPSSSPTSPIRKTQAPAAQRGPFRLGLWRASTAATLRS